MPLNVANSSRSNKTSQTGLRFSKYLFIWFPISSRTNNTIKGMYASHRDNSIELTWNKQEAHKGSCGLTIWKVYLIEILFTNGGCGGRMKLLNVKVCGFNAHWE